MSDARDNTDDLPGVLGVMQGVAEQKWPHTMDAKVWAAKWLEITKDMPRESFSDEGYMIGWFANAIMAGFDTANLRNSRHVDRILGELAGLMNHDRP